MNDDRQDNKDFKGNTHERDRHSGQSARHPRVDNPGRRIIASACVDTTGTPFRRLAAAAGTV